MRALYGDWRYSAVMAAAGAALGLSMWLAGWPLLAGAIWVLSAGAMHACLRAFYRDWRYSAAMAATGAALGLSMLLGGWPLLAVGFWVLAAGRGVDAWDQR